VWKSHFSAIRALALGIWPGLTRFLKGGRLELDTNPFENQIHSFALTRKNALFAG
jgi:transposase